MTSNHPNGLVYEGDIYGFNYDLHAKKYSLGHKVAFTGKVIDVFGSAQISSSSFYRDGKMKTVNSLIILFFWQR